MSGAVVWVTGLPASGKTTLARRLAARLAAPPALLDSDEVREAFGDHAYEAGAREDFYRRLAGLAALLARQGFVVVVAATANRRRYRAAARALAPRFLEVWVKVSPEEVAARDPKGLYARARRGELPRLPGAGEPYEEPEAPDVVAAGGLDDAAAAEVVRRLEESRPITSRP